MEENPGKVGISHWIKVVVAKNPHCLSSSTEELAMVCSMLLSQYRVEVWRDGLVPKKRVGLVAI